MIFYVLSFVKFWALFFVGVLFLFVLGFLFLLGVRLGAVAIGVEGGYTVVENMTHLICNNSILMFISQTVFNFFCT